MAWKGSLRRCLLAVFLAACSGGRGGGHGSGDGPQGGSALHGDVAQVGDGRPTLTYAQRQGQRLFLHYCAVCHGTHGAGDGFNAWNLNPRPRDLTDPTYHKAVSDAWLTEVISLGGLAVNKSNLMPAWKHTLNQAQITAVVAFARSLGDTSGAADTEFSPPGIR